MKSPSPSSGVKAYGQQSLSWIDRTTIRHRVSLAKTIIQQSVTDSLAPAEILELGCGFRGLNVHALAAQFPTMHFDGVDIQVSPNESTGVALIEADITRWSPTKQYDVVLSLAVVEHLIEPLAHFQLIQQCLKPGGSALLTSPTPPNHAVWGTLSNLRLIHDSISEHKLYLTKAGIEALALASQLEVVQYQTFQFGLNQWVWLRHAEKPRA